LFEAATSNGVAATSGATIPTDIATAAFNIAHNPGAASVVGLWNSGGTNPPFAPNLGSAPNDFTVAITYPVTAPAGLAIDATGNVFVATNSTTAGYITGLLTQGTTPITSATGGKGMSSVAIDPSGNVWASAKTSNALYEYTSTLGAVTGSPFTVTGLTNPNQIAIDTSGNVYVAETQSSNSGPTLELSNAGMLLYTVDSSQNAYAVSIALDKVGTATDVWLVSKQNNLVTLFGNPSGGSSTVGPSSSYSTPEGIAVDNAGNGWLANGQGNRPLYKISTTGAATYWGTDSSGNNAIGGLSAPKWVAIDGGENVWVTNSGNSSISEISGATFTLAYSPSTGYQKGNSSEAAAIEVDGSGDVWIANQTGNNVMEIVGVATPVTTPLSAQKPGVEP
jgi:sugar lactone lactonase YvrE